MRNCNYNIWFLILILCFSCNSKKPETTYEVENNIPKKENWESIFNGKNLEDWIVKIKGYPINENAKNTFRVEDGLLKVSYDDYDKFGEAYGHIFYKKPFSNYKLRLEYRFVGKQLKDGAGWAKKNSGVMLHAQSPESMGLNQEFPVSLEAQFLGGIEQGVARPTANLCTPGTHVNIDGNLVTNHCLNSTSSTYFKEEWVSVEFHVYNDSLVKHLVDGKEVFRYTKPTIGGEYVPENWKNKEGNALKEGYIALQSESHPVEFRNIELFQLK